MRNKFAVKEEELCKPHTPMAPAFPFRLWQREESERLPAGGDWGAFGWNLVPASHGQAPPRMPMWVEGACTTG